MHEPGKQRAFELGNPFMFDIIITNQNFHLPENL